MTTPRGPNNAAHFFPQATSDHSAAAFAQQHGTPGQYHEERPYAPSPHHFDYMPHSYGGHPSRMASPMNVPPMGSPMTVPGGYPMEPLHGHSMEPMHAHAAALHHPGSHGHLLQHGMGLPPPQAPQQFAMGMEGQSHHAMHQPPPPMPPQIAAGHGLPSWSPPTVPPYNGAQRSNCWHHQQQGGGGGEISGGWGPPPPGSLDFGSTDYGYHGGNFDLPPPPPPPPPLCQ